MPERRPVVSGLVVKYSGLLNMRDVWNFIDNWFAECGFGDRVEVYHDEKVTKEHKDIEVRYEPYKKVSDYMKITHRLTFQILNLVKKTIEKDGHKMKIDQADFRLQIDSFLDSDYEGRWENKPEFYFIRTIVDKFIFKTYTGKYESMAKSQAAELRLALERYLNMTKFDKETR